MSLLTRLISPNAGEVKLPVHQFMSALSEYKRKIISSSQLATAFNLTIEEQTQLNAFLTNMDTDVINREVLHDVLMLGEGGYYTITQVKNRLGV
jgi:hypothetical protein